jgi:altronate dehydratase
MPPVEQNNAVIHHQDDNVAIAVRPINAGETVVVDAEERVTAAEDVDVGHKIALCAIESGGTVYRYGEPIIEATEAIQVGAWVHVHNTRPIPGDVEV